MTISILAWLFCLSFLSAQTPDCRLSLDACRPTPTAPICLTPKTLDEGAVNTPYSGNIQMNIGLQALFQGRTFNITSAEIVAVNNLPAGLNIAFLSSNRNDGNGGVITSFPARLTPANSPMTTCATISGTPTAPTSPTDSVEVVVRLTIQGLPAQLIPPIPIRFHIPIKDEIIIGPVFSVNAGADRTITCGGQTQLQAVVSPPQPGGSGGITFSWSPATGLSNPNAANPIARPVATTTYIVTATNAQLNQTARDTVVVFVNKANFNLNFTANPTVMNAPPYTTTFTLTNFNRTLQYTLFYGDGGSDQLRNNIATYTYSDTGLYSPMLVARNPVTGCSDTLLRSNYIRVESPLVVSLSPASVSIPCGEITRVTATANQTGNITWNWEPATGVSNPNIANPSLSPVVTTTYTVTATLGNQKASSTVTVVVQKANFNVGFSATPTNLTSRPFVVNFTNSTAPVANYTYTWNFGDGNSSNEVNPRHTYQNNGTYAVQLIATQASTGCRDTLTRPAYIVADDGSSAPLAVTVTSDTAANCGDRIELSAKANLPNTTFQWTPTTGLSNPAIANPVATPSTTTTYTVTARNGSQIARAVVVLTINPVEITNLQDEYCSNAQAFQLTATVPGGTYTGPLTGLTPQGNFSPSQAGPGNYNIRYVGTRNGCSFTTSKPVRVTAPPTATVEGLATQYCTTSEPVSLKVSPEGGQLSVETTFPGGTPPNGGISGTNFIPSVLPAGVYRVRYTGTLGPCTYTTLSNFTRIIAAPQVRISGLNATYCQNDPSATMTAEPTGGTFSGSGVTGNIFNPAESNTGEVHIIYSRPATNPSECPALDTVTVTVFPKPDFVFLFNRPDPGQSNGRISINVTAGTAPYQYKLNGGSFQASNIFNNLPAGTYEVTVRDANGCAYARTLNLTANCPGFTIRSTGATTFCATGANFTLLTLNGNPPANTGFQWQRNEEDIAGQTANNTRANQTGAYRLIVRVPFCPDTATNAINITANPLPTLTATVTDATGATNTDGAITLEAANGQAPYQYRRGTTGAFQNNPEFSGLTPGVYTFTARDARGCTSAVATFTVSVKIVCPEPTITTESALEFCSGGEAVLRADIGQDFSYQWQKNGANISNATEQTFSVKESGAYTVIIKKTGCQDVTAQPVTVTVSPLPALSFTTEDPVGSLTNGKIMASATSGTEPYLFALGTGIFGDNSAFEGLGAGDYVLKVKDANNCQAETTVTLKSIAINCPTTATITPAGPLSFCEGGNVELNANTGTDFIYVWRRNGQLISEAAQSSLTATQSGNYSLSITKLGCLDSAHSTAVLVTVNAVPQLSVTVTDAVNGANGSIRASASAGTAPYQFRLNSQAFQSSGTFNGLVPGNFSVTVRDSKGCEAQAQATIENITSEEYTVWPGDANNDGVVDVTDYFIIASGFGKTGPVRTEQGADWRGYKTNALWPSTTNYRGATLNDLYLDANGDGVIDMQDVDLAKQYRGREVR